MRLLRGGPALAGHDELDRREAASRAAASTVVRSFKASGECLIDSERSELTNCNIC